MQKRRRAGSQAHAEVHIHMRRLARLRRQHARTQARVGAHTHTRAHTRTGAHARTQRHTCSLVCVGMLTHARSFV